jgi:hypothetical protein
MRISKHIYNYVKQELLDFEHTKHEYDAYVQMIAYSIGPDREMVDGGSLSDKTAQAGMKLVSTAHVQHMEWLIDGITHAMQGWTDEQLILYDAYYRQNKLPSYVMDVNVWGRNKFYRMNRQIILSVARELRL